MFLQVFYSIFVGFMFFLPMALKLLTSHHNHRWYNIVLNFKKENKNAWLSKQFCWFFFIHFIFAIFFFIIRVHCDITVKWFYNLLSIAAYFSCMFDVHLHTYVYYFVLCDLFRQECLTRIKIKRKIKQNNTLMIKYQFHSIFANVYHFVIRCCSTKWRFLMMRQCFKFHFTNHTQSRRRRRKIYISKNHNKWCLCLQIKRKMHVYLCIMIHK